MTTRSGAGHLSTRAMVVAVVALVAVLVCFRPGVTTTEAGTGTWLSHAAGFAVDGVDGSGRAWPLFVHAGGEVWLQPIPVYALSVLMGAGFEAGTAARLLAGVSGALSAWLIFLVGRRLFATPRPAVMASALFVLTPGYLALGAAGSPALAVLPPVLAWLLAVVACLERPRPRVLALGAAALTLGVYIQPVGVLMLPVYVVVGAAVLARHGADRRLVLWSGLGMALALLPLALWFLLNPETWPDTMGRWAIHLAHIRDPWQGMVSFTRLDVAGRRAGDYWHLLSPVYLFLSGSVFFMVTALLVPLGLVGRTLTRGSAAWWLLTAAFLAAPLAAVLLDEPRSIERAVALLPFGALLAALGVERLLQSGSALARRTPPSAGA